MWYLYIKRLKDNVVFYILFYNSISLDSGLSLFHEGNEHVGGWFDKGIPMVYHCYRHFHMHNG